MISNRNIAKILLALIIILTAAGLFWWMSGTKKTAEQKHPKQIAILTASDLQLTTMEGIKTGLKEMGIREGVDYSISLRNPQGDRDLTKKFATDIVNAKPDLIISISTTASSAIIDANKNAFLPTVAVDVGNLKELGIENIQHPGGFLSGVVSDNVAVAPKRMEILKTLLPKIKKLGVLVNPKHVSYNDLFPVYVEAAKKLNLDLIWYPVTKKEDLAGTMERITKERPDAIMITAEAIISGNPDLIAPILTKANIPSIDFNIEKGVSAGYLMVYGAGRFEIGRQGARMIVKVLRGENPGNLPIEFVAPKDFEINAALAHKMGIKIPDSLLLEASKVYN